jgi:SAM-dependent methyltransferase
MAGASWKEYWKGTEESFLERQIQNYKATWGYHRLLKAVPECTTPGKVLEVGAGKAYLSQILRNKGWRTTAIDLNSDIVKVNSTKVDKYVIGDMLNLPFADKSFDLVISCGLIEHFPRDIVQQIISEKKRVGKRVVAWLPTCGIEWKIVWGIRNSLGGNVYTRSYKFKRETLEEIFISSGLHHVETGVILFGGFLRYIYVYGIS